MTTTSSARVIGFLELFALLIPMRAPAKNPPMPEPASSAGLAFARYIASLHERNPFTESGPVAVEIEASLPSLYKESRFLVIRDTGESERSEYQVLRMEGDAIVVQEVIAPYLRVQEHLEDLPLSSVAITPANYKFHYRGEVGTGGALAFVYQITPKKKRSGLIQGQLWIDSMTGAALVEMGRFVKAPSPSLGRVEVVRDTELLDGSPRLRTTHVTIQTPRAGQGELTITEVPLAAAEKEHPLNFVPLAKK
jgi:hypothetical protein